MEYEYWFAKIRGISARKKCLLHTAFKTAENIYNIEEKELTSLELLKEKELQVLMEAKRQSVSEAYEALEKASMQCIHFYSEQYPERLKKIPSPPYALYVKGKLPKERVPSVAIVGARGCSAYGERMALEFGKRLGSAGVQVISGMARGIDGVAQRGAVSAGGSSYGVLACGADVCYPRENIGLYMDLQEYGGILSEQPPGTKPLASFFPARNRIISGLADLILIIEAREKSGSLITADMALEQGKDVYALPGPVDSPLSVGCHRLIRQGAGILISPDDLLEEMHLFVPKVAQINDKNEKKLESTENILYSCLGFTPKGVEQLTEETKMSARAVLEALITLELTGKVKEISKNNYVRI